MSGIFSAPTGGAAGTGGSFIADTITVADQAARLALTASEVQPGDIVKQTDNGELYLLKDTDPSLVASWDEISLQAEVSANSAKVSADGSVTTHSDVTDAGSGAIITASERTDIGTNKTHAGLVAGNPHSVDLQDAYADGQTIDPDASNGPVLVTIDDDWTTNPNNAGFVARAINGAIAVSAGAVSADDGADLDCVFKAVSNAAGAVVNGGVDLTNGVMFILNGPDSRVGANLGVQTILHQGDADYVSAIEAQAGNTLGIALQTLVNRSGNDVPVILITQEADFPALAFNLTGHGDAADIRLATLAADPTAPANGDVWYKDRPKVRVAGATEELAFTSEVDGTLSVEIRTDVGPYTALATDDVIVVDPAAPAAYTVNLPAATVGKKYTIKRNTTGGGANAVTVDANGAETIDGSTTYNLGNQYDSVTLVGISATEWVVI